MKYLVQTNNITEEKNKDLDYNRVILNTENKQIYVISKPTYHLVDLGLPSGTLWMDRNIGAKEITDSGLYFAWGETQGYTADEVGVKKQFTWYDYKFGEYEKLSKYNGTDGLIELELSDDAAYKYTNGKCKMPTKELIEELLDSTNAEYTSINQVNGYLLHSTVNSNTIFLPCSGYVKDSEVANCNIVGRMLCNKISFFSSGEINTYYNSFLQFTESEITMSDLYYYNVGRCCGQSVRGVMIKQ